MGFPPAEDRDISLTGMGIKDPFCSELRPAQRQQMLEMEESATDSIFVILSDIQLDRPLVSECKTRKQDHIFCVLPVVKSTEYE